MNDQALIRFSGYDRRSRDASIEQTRPSLQVQAPFLVPAPVAEEALDVEDGGHRLVPGDHFSGRYGSSLRLPFHAARPVFYPAPDEIDLVVTQPIASQRHGPGVELLQQQALQR